MYTWLCLRFFGNPINAKAMVGIYRIVSGLYKLTIKIIFGQEAFVEFLNEFLRFDLAQAIAAYFLQTLILQQTTILASECLNKSNIPA